MHERARGQMIMAMLRGRSVVRVRDIVDATGASGASIRRDMGKLVEMGLARRIHGGVESIEQVDRPVLSTRPFQVSQTLNIERKRAIAQVAASIPADGDAVIINGGTTTFQMVEFLRERRLGILTNSFPIAEALIHGSQNRIILPGGQVYREQNIILSAFDDDAIQHYSASRMFMSAASIGPHGVIEGDALLARAETKLLKRAEKLVVLADGSKFAARGSLVVCPLSRVDMLITDDGAPQAALDMLRAAGIEVRVVKMDLNASSVA